MCIKDKWIVQNWSINIQLTIAPAFSTQLLAVIWKPIIHFLVLGAHELVLFKTHSIEILVFAFSPTSCSCSWNIPRGAMPNGVLRIGLLMNNSQSLSHSPHNLWQSGTNQSENWGWVHINWYLARQYPLRFSSPHSSPPDVLISGCWGSGSEDT